MFPARRSRVSLHQPRRKKMFSSVAYPCLYHEARHAVDAIEHVEHLHARLVQRKLVMPGAAVQGVHQANSLAQKVDTQTILRVETVPEMNDIVTDELSSHVRDLLTKQVMQSIPVSPGSSTIEPKSTNTSGPSRHSKATATPRVFPICSTSETACETPSTRTAGGCNLKQVMQSMPAVSGFNTSVPGSTSRKPGRHNRSTLAVLPSGPIGYPAWPRPSISSPLTNAWETPSRRTAGSGVLVLKTPKPV